MALGLGSLPARLPESSCQLSLSRRREWVYQWTIEAQHHVVIEKSERKVSNACNVGKVPRSFRTHMVFRRTRITVVNGKHDAYVDGIMEVLATLLTTPLGREELETRTVFLIAATGAMSRKNIRSTAKSTAHFDSQ